MATANVTRTRFGPVGFKLYVTDATKGTTTYSASVAALVGVFVASKQASVAVKTVNFERASGQVAGKIFSVQTSHRAVSESIAAAAVSLNASDLS